MSFKKVNQICALSVFTIVFLGFFRLMAPSVSFWDCGEYAAVGNILGIPHPPGNPLYVMLSRCFVMALPFFKDIAFRMNLISVFATSLIAVLMYLSIVRIFIGWLGQPETKEKMSIVCVAGIVGALFSVFGYTMMFSTVESQAKASILFLPIILCVYYAIVWCQSSHDARRDRYLVLCIYIGFLGLGIHQQAMLIFLPLFLLVIVVSPEKRKDFKFILTCFVCALVYYSPIWFMFVGIGIIIVNLLMAYSTKGDHKKQWKFALYLAFFALLGYSVHTYIPIRSSLQPMVDENHPVSWEAFRGYIERKQYGSESMMTRMFWRRGSWSNQFGVEGHMGFGGFFLTQFYRLSLTDTQKNFFSEGFGVGTMKLVIYIIPTLIMLWAWLYLYKRYKTITLFLIFFTIMTTIGMVFAMNFGDGTKAEKAEYEQWVSAGKPGPMPLGNREVRVRDYFFLVGFVFYGMWMGIAAGCVLNALYTHPNRRIRTGFAPGCALLLLLTPAIPYSHNQGLNNRKNDTVPFDFAYNLLNSCEKDAVMFTNGDNDTFPLWALQEAFNIRRDVRIVNLSLVNTDWYIKQLKHLEPKVPISFTDKEIEQLRPELNPFQKPAEYVLEDAGLTVRIPGRDEKNAFMLQDKMVLNIVNATKWQKPVYFSMTTGMENTMGLEPYLKLEGLVFRLMKQPVPEAQRVDKEKTKFFLDKIYRFKEINQPKILFDETYHITMSYYLMVYLQLALSYREDIAVLMGKSAELEKLAADSTRKDRVELTKELALTNDSLKTISKTVCTELDKCIALVPWADQARTLRQQFASLQK